MADAANRNFAGQAQMNLATVVRSRERWFVPFQGVGREEGQLRADGLAGGKVLVLPRQEAVVWARRGCLRLR